MKVAAAVAEILKREGVSWLIGYPVNPIIEAAAQAASAPAGSTPAPAEVRSTLANADTPEGGSAEEDERAPAKSPDPDSEDEQLDEELEESFPASDPPQQP